FLNVARPELLAAEVERLQDPGAGHYPDVLPVGDRRRRRHVLLPLLMIAAAERPLPDHGASVAIDAPEKQIVAAGHLEIVGDVEKNFLAPDDGCRAGPGRHGELPRNVLSLRPAGRQVLLAAHAVERRP